MEATTIEGFGQASTAAPKDTDNGPDASTDFHGWPNSVGALVIMPTSLTGARFWLVCPDGKMSRISRRWCDVEFFR